MMRRRDRRGRRRERIGDDRRSADGSRCQMPMGSPSAIRATAVLGQVPRRGTRNDTARDRRSGARKLVDVTPARASCAGNNSPAATAATLFAAFVTARRPDGWTPTSGGAVRADGDIALHAEDEIGMAGIAPRRARASRRPAPKHDRARARRADPRIKPGVARRRRPRPPPVTTHRATAAAASRSRTVRPPNRRADNRPRRSAQRSPAPRAIAALPGNAPEAPRSPRRHPQTTSPPSATEKRATCIAPASPIERKPATPTTPAGTTIAVTTAPADSASSRRHTPSRRSLAPSSSSGSAPIGQSESRKSGDPSEHAAERRWACLEAVQRRRRICREARKHPRAISCLRGTVARFEWERREADARTSRRPRLSRLEGPAVRPVS